MSLFRVYGLTALNDSSYPTVEMRINVGAVTLLNPSDGTTKDLIAPTGNIGCAINSSGAGARDSATAYTAGQNVWFYLIWGATPGLNAINSPNDPTVGPTLPSGYTNYAPLFPVVIQPGVALANPLQIAGNKAFYKNPAITTVVENPTPNTSYSQSYSSYIPTCAESLRAFFEADGVYSTGTYGAQGGFVIQATSGENYLNLSLYCNPVTWALNANALVADIPLDPSMAFEIIFLLGVGTYYAPSWPNLSVSFLGYTFP